MNRMNEVLNKVKVYPFPPDFREQVAASVKRRLPTKRTFLNHARHNVTNYDALRYRYNLDPAETEILKRYVNRRLAEELNQWHRVQITYGWPGLPD